jgi:hypothetical protein
MLIKHDVYCSHAAVIVNQHHVFVACLFVCTAHYTQSGIKMDTSVCKVLLKALHIAGRLDDADRVYADVCTLTHTSHWSSVHTTVQTIDFHTYSVHMCYTALRSVFSQVRSASHSSTLFAQGMKCISNTQFLLIAAAAAVTEHVCYSSSAVYRFTSYYLPHEGTLLYCGLHMLAMTCSLLVMLHDTCDQMLANYQAKQVHTANNTNGYTNGNATATGGSSSSIVNDVNQNDPCQDLVIITGIGKSRSDGEASVIKPCIQVYAVYSILAVHIAH